MKPDLNELFLEMKQEQCMEFLNFITNKDKPFKNLSKVEKEELIRVKKKYPEK